MSRALIVSATTTEALFLLRAFPTNSGWEEGDSYLLTSGPRLHVAVTGVGPKAAEAGLRRVLADLDDVSAVLGIGFAGGLTKAARPGDLVIPTSVLNGRNTETPTEWLRMALAALSSGQTWRLLTTVDHVVSSPAQKAAIHAATDAEAVDMESGVWGTICREMGLPWAVVRTVLDSSAENLPAELSRAVDSFGRIRLAGLLGLLIGRPGLLPQFYKMRTSHLRTLAEPYANVVKAWLALQGEKRRNAGGAPAVNPEVAKSA
jgi:adenosylhomocysteine nucleosidase